MSIKLEELDKYIKKVFGKEAKILGVETIRGEVYIKGEIKEYGYGEPLLLRVEMEGREKKYVLNTIKPGMFGHEYVSDRAAILIWNHLSYNKLPKHVRSVDLGYFTKDMSLISMDTPIEFFQVVEFAEGREYFNDLHEIGERKSLNGLDKARCIALSEYLADIHRVKRRDGQLYRRRIRELIGHGEAIMGLIDSYRGDEEFLRHGELMDIEFKCLEWRWRLKDKGYRLSQVHGDYHPWNIKFVRGNEFILLDRSRGEWGEPADDIAALTINYMFFSLMYYENYQEPFKKLLDMFIDRYLDLTGDDEVLRVIQPFYAWRGLVIASPIWYPKLKFNIRRMIFNFINNVLDTEYFEFKRLDEYLR